MVIELADFTIVEINSRDDTYFTVQSKSEGPGLGGQLHKDQQYQNEEDEPCHQSVVKPINNYLTISQIRSISAIHSRTLGYKGAQHTKSPCTVYIRKRQFQFFAKCG